MSKRAGAKLFTRLHLALMVSWAILLAPTFLWWSDSIPWLIFMSWYANFVGHFGAWQGARAERRAE